MRLQCSLYTTTDKENGQKTKFMKGVEEAIAKSGTINRRHAHFMFVGPPGSGKSSLMDRLLGRRRKRFSPSTGVCNSVVIVDIDMTTSQSTFHSVTVLDVDNWKEIECGESFLGQMHPESIVVPEQLETLSSSAALFIPRESIVKKFIRKFGRSSTFSASPYIPRKLISSSIQKQAFSRRAVMAGRLVLYTSGIQEVSSSFKSYWVFWFSVHLYFSLSSDLILISPTSLLCSTG